MASIPHIVCIFNPEAGMGRFKIGPEELKDMFQKASEKAGKPIDLEMEETHRPGDAERISRERSANDIDIMVACGGDGTIYEVINGIAGTGISLGIVPLGSGNDDLVSITGARRSIEDCISDIIEGAKHPIDIARMNDRYFMNVVGVGMDAAINHEVARRRDMVKRFGPTIQYVYCTLRVIPAWKDMEVLLTIDDGEPEKRKAKMLTIGNGTTCGGGFRLTPKAKMDDGKLDMSLIKSAGTLKTMIKIPKAFKGEHTELDMTIYKQFRRMKVESLEGRKLPYHIDGEKGFTDSFDFEILENKLTTVHPLPP